MKLKEKSAAILGTVIGLSVVLNFTVLEVFISPSFEELEHRQAQRNMERVLEAFNAEISRVFSSATDYAAWDDAYHYAISKEKNFVDVNLTLSAFENLKVSSIHIYDTSNKLIIGKHFVFESEEERYDSVSDSDTYASAETSLANLRSLDVDRGIVLTEEGPTLFGSAPILDSNRNGLERGTLVMGRPLDDELVESLRKQTRVDFQVRPTDKVTGEAAD